MHPHVTVKVVDPDTGETLQRGQTGELCTGGYRVMIGYWNDPDKTAEAIDSDGFKHTGDLAVMDADSYPSIVGRSKDMVIRGGENIYWVRLRDGEPELTAEALKDYCTGKLAHYKAPKYVRLTDEFPTRHRQDPEVQDARDVDRGA